MKILVITGNLAAPLVKNMAKKIIAKKPEDEIIVHVADTQIAAFLTPNRIIKEIKNSYSSDLEEIDMIIVPGLIRKPSTEIAEALGVPTFKGPTDAADLEMVFELINEIELSETKTADRLIEEEKQKKAIEFIYSFESDIKLREKLLKKPNNILVGKLAIGEDFPMRVLAEIANAPSLTKEELISKAKYFCDNGADMIDIGMIAGENMSHKIPELIAILREVIGDRPLSIDTLNPNELKVAIQHDIDLVLSLDLGNYNEVLPLLKEKAIPAVLLPTNYKKGFVSHKPHERVEAMNELIEKCQGIDVIVDMVLDPINSNSIVDSIVACREFKKNDKKSRDLPLFFGVGNVTELLDVDSPGVNSLLSGIAMELGASVLFTPDESGKTWNSVYELAISSKMMFLAKNRGSIPKDLGLNLVLFKDKKKRQKEIAIESSGAIGDIDGKNNVPVYIAENDPKFVHDSEGSFKINVIHGTRYDKSKIIVTHFKKGIADLAIEGTDYRKIYNEILERNLLSQFEHAAYLGAELQKAEIAMITGKEYIQDFELFKKPLIFDNF
ncbi:MAG: dihydropteroate synthase-like protein [Methanobrevibacter sp.]|nr:dihydropteroate synthase-like protein [Methanobrevibacter sp.]